MIHLQKQWFTHKIYIHFKTYNPEPILEIKAMRAVFQKQGKKMLKKAKYMKIWAKINKVWKSLKKGRWLRVINAGNKLLEKAL